MVVDTLSKIRRGGRPLVADNPAAKAVVRLESCKQMPGSRSVHRPKRWGHTKKNGAALPAVEQECRDVFVVMDNRLWLPWIR